MFIKYWDADKKNPYLENDAIPSPSGYNLALWRLIWDRDVCQMFLNPSKHHHVSLS